MSKRKYSEVDMIGALKQMEAGRTAADVGRELGVSKHTIYAWKAKHGGRSTTKSGRTARWDTWPRRHSRAAIRDKPRSRSYQLGRFKRRTIHCANFGGWSARLMVWPQSY